MNTKTNTPLVLAFIIVVVVFLLFCGGAISMTMFCTGMNHGMNNGMNNNGFFNNISWMWVPTIVAFIVSVLLGWVLFSKKE
ncbi:MAG: hypothetical protein M0P61_04010 [Ignavibacteriaceae bacterium]|jgi:hypothetical protein|nr:hypothetical protein [Ignavibacteriaceae bacterium]